MTRRAPSSPSDIAARREARRLAALAHDARERRDNPARWNDAADPSRVEALRASGARVITDGRGRVSVAKRCDVFDTLYSREAITGEQLGAIRRLERDMAERAGVRPGAAELGTIIDGGAGDTGGLTQRMLDAGKRVDEALAAVGPPACRVLAAILEPGVTVGRPADWRAAIQSITGEARAEAQAALLRFACQALADVYDAADKKRAKQ